jgi:hypothetical protein
MSAADPGGFRRTELEPEVAAFVDDDDTGENPIIVVNSEQPHSSAVTAVRAILHKGLLSCLPVVQLLGEPLRRLATEQTAAVACGVMVVAGAGGAAVLSNSTESPARASPPAVATRTLDRAAEPSPAFRLTRPARPSPQPQRAKAKERERVAEEWPPTPVAETPSAGTPTADSPAAETPSASSASTTGPSPIDSPAPSDTPTLDPVSSAPAQTAAPTGDAGVQPEEPGDVHVDVPAEPVVDLLSEVHSVVDDVVPDHH